MSAPPSSVSQWRTRTAAQALRAFSASRALVLAALLLTQALTLAAALWTERQAQERGRRAQTQANLTQLTRVTAEGVRAHLHTAEQTVRLSSANLRSELLPADNPARLLVGFGALLDNVPQLSSVMVGHPDGRFVFAQRHGPANKGRFTRVIEVRPARQMIDRTYSARGSLLNTSRADDGYDPRTRPWYSLAQARAGQVVWTPPYEFATSHQPGITVAEATVTPSGPLVVAADVQTQQLASLLSALPLGSQSRAFLADASGHAIATSRPWPQTTGDAPLLAEVADEPLRALLDPQGRLQLYPRAQWLRVAGQTYVAVVQPVQMQSGEPWLVGVYGPATDFTGSGGRRGMWPLVLLASLLSGLLAWPLVRRATHPIAELQRQATTDALTGLPNRASFLAQLDEQLRTPGPGALGVAIFDLDGFKGVNDTFGHPVGDEVLHAVGARMLAAAQIGDTLGRLGGDEFALLVQAATPEEIRLRVEGVLDAVGRRPIAAAGLTHALTSTAGLAFLPPGVLTTPGVMLARADTALIRGKRREKGRVWVDGEVTMPTLFR
ncbi:diguanylate cyclase [Deinococcus sp. HMF7620]|uniref:Diguanylate cyclase n=1 Tax=Deinococcus arboris TaxID=2682977 RepID=A0A7C9HP53_9DEIO|nr:sensor domain-containing diguanylate cyclase [Deinococcus arboris]MVN85212.1 diguanylate cyclase [Deinococcus arboris]